jgi:hypothetical protein
MDNSIIENNNHKKNPLRFGWILPVLFTPKKALEKVTSEEKSVWLTPLLVISVLIILSVMVAAPIRRGIIEMGMNIPEDFQYYSAEQQAAFMTGQANRVSPLFLYGFPMLTKLAGLWISWFLLSSILHLSLTLAGSRANNVRFYNLTGWSLLPVAIRHLVQIFAMLFTKTVVSSPGLSGFITADTGFAAFLSSVLGQIDIFFIWQIVLLLIGVLTLSGLVKSKAWSATAVTLLILILLLAVPGILSHSLSGLTLSTGFYF